MALITINITEELKQRLKNEKNYSLLIRDLLNAYYQKTDINSMNIEELNKLLKVEQIKEEMQNRIKEVENANN